MLFAAFAALTLIVRATAYTLFSEPGFPGGSPSANTAAMIDLINKVSYSNGNTINIPAGTYEFQLGGSGQMPAFADAHNLLIQGSPYGSTLVWNGGSVPHSFFRIDGACRNVTIQAMEIATKGYSTGTYDSNGRELGMDLDDGAHIKIEGKHISVVSVVFKGAPGFAIQISGANDRSDPDSIHIDSNLFINNYKDGVHVTSGTDIWIVGNRLIDCGDDSIAVVNDDYETNLRLPSDIYILSNTIENGHYRGVVVGTGENITIHGNIIAGTAYHGIEVASLYTDVSQYPQHNTPWARNLIFIRQNTITDVGTQKDHETNNLVPVYSVGIKVGPDVAASSDRVWNLQIYDNSINGVTGHGLQLHNIATLGVGGVYAGTFNWGPGFNRIDYDPNTLTNLYDGIY